MNRDSNGRFARSPLTFTERVEAEVWADLKAQTAAVIASDLDHQERAVALTEFFDQAAERLQWLGVTA